MGGRACISAACLLGDYYPSMTHDRLISYTTGLEYNLDGSLVKKESKPTVRRAKLNTTQDMEAWFADKMKELGNV